MKLASALLFVFATFAAFAGDSLSPSQPELIGYPIKGIADWGKDHAVQEAEADLKAGKPKLYLSGTIAISTPGLTKEERHRLRGLPTAEAGVGCVVWDDHDAQLRKAQSQYAEIYNRYIAENYHPK